ncbi:hypothetical protein BGZ63DRAFT_212322 [Mariannaea sp. PMI_226]|nr:hypothetical protein BGZ63DRAFT_212322 [Mariannaea sp. PMI_226]
MTYPHSSLPPETLQTLSKSKSPINKVRRLPYPYLTPLAPSPHLPFSLSLTYSIVQERQHYPSNQAPPPRVPRNLLLSHRPWGFCSGLLFVKKDQVRTHAPPPRDSTNRSPFHFSFMYHFPHWQTIPRPEKFGQKNSLFVFLAGEAGGGAGQGRSCDDGKSGISLVTPNSQYEGAAAKRNKRGRREETSGLGLGSENFFLLLPPCTAMGDTSAIYTTS